MKYAKFVFLIILACTLISILFSCESIEKNQTPQPPFDYIVQEVSVFNRYDKITLEGILTYPNRSQEYVGGFPVKTPVVILYSGSSPHNYDEEWQGHKPFAVLADHLTKNGIAVLRLNDRDYKKDPIEFYQNTTEDFSRDLLSAVEYIKNQQYFEDSTIGLLGHSEGGIVSSMVAADNPDIDFLILLGSPGLSLDTMTMQAAVLSYELSGMPPSEIDRMMEYHNDYNNIVRNFVSNKEAKKQAGILYDSYFRGTPAFNRNDRYNIVTKVTLPWYRYMWGNDPAYYLERVKCPVLAITGEFDSQVLPDQNLGAIQNALIKGGNKNYTIKKMKNLNHALQPTNSYRDYSDIEETLSIPLLNEVTNWVNKIQLMLYS